MTTTDDALLAKLGDDFKRQELWWPLRDPKHPDRPTPQQLAFESQADVLYYGGNPGGGKSDLLLGLALTAHQQSIIFRREARQLIGIEQRLTQILGSRKGYNAQDRIWAIPGRERLVELGHCQHLGDEIGYQGRPHDLIGFDEIPHFLKQQFEFLKTWKRTVVDQRTRVVCAGNPPTTPEGEWVVAYWAPWLDRDHPNPAEPGEIRWFAEVGDETIEVENGDAFMHQGRRIKPESRTFIPSVVQDNPYLMETGYGDTLDAMPTWLRDQLTSFDRATEDAPYQVIPSAWVDAAQDRWREMGGPAKAARMTALGIDPAQGGVDQFVMAPRYGQVFGELLVTPGKKVTGTSEAVALVVTALRDGAVAAVDIDGPGGPLYGRLEQAGVPCSGMAGGRPSTGRDITGLLQFYNKRSEWVYRLREDLDPDGSDPIALPPDRQLKADLCSLRRIDAGDVRNIRIESKKEVKKRIGRSPDKGDAVMYANACGDEPIENQLPGRATWATPVVERSYDPRRW